MKICVLGCHAHFDSVPLIVHVRPRNLLSAGIVISFSLPEYLAIREHVRSNYEGN